MGAGGAEWLVGVVGGVECVVRVWHGEAALRRVGCHVAW